MEDAKKLKQYLDDIVRIRTLMEKNEEIPFIEMWVFILWGVLVIIGTYLSAYAVHTAELTPARLYLIIWLPILVIGAAAETAAFFRRSAKAPIPVMSQRYIRFIIAFAGVLISLMFLLYRLAEGQVPIAGMILLISSIPLFLYGMVSLSSFYIEGFLILSAGIVVFILEQVGVGTSPIWSGLAAGLMYIISGLHGMRSKTEI